MGLYIRCQTQWRYSSMGQRTGLDYAAVEATARLAGNDVGPETFDGLQVIERTFLDVDREQAESGDGRTED